MYSKSENPLEEIMKGENMVNKVIVGAAQMGPSSYKQGEVDKRTNVQRILALMEKAIKEKVKIVCFVECCLTDFFAMRNNRDYDYCFDQIPNELTEDVFTLTKEHPISVILPYGEFDGVTYYNTAAFIARGELLGKYRKIHIPGAWVPEAGVVIFEKQYFTPGNLGYPVYDFDGVKVGVQICYDRFFPEGYRALALKGAQIVFNPTALAYRGVEMRVLTWEPLLRIRSVENNVFVVAVNRGGLENDVDFAGESSIINPIAGEVIVKTKTKGDELITAEIDLDDILEAKKNAPVFRDRRPSEYKALVE